MFCQLVRCFADSTSLLLEDYPAHNEAISGDSLFSIQLNYKWRKLLVGLLQKAWVNDLSERALDNHDFLSALILDLYTAEALNVGMVTRSIGFDLSTNKTTNSTSFVAVAGSAWNHTFTKKNVIIRCSDIVLNAAGGESATVKLDLDGQTPVNIQEARVLSSTVRTISCAHVYLNIPLGSRQIQLLWKVSGGTATMAAATYLHFEIIEYD